MAKPGPKRLTDSGARHPTDSRELQRLARSLREKARRRRLADRQFALSVGHNPGTDLSRDERATIANSRERQVRATALVATGRSALGALKLLARGGSPIYGPSRTPRIAGEVAKTVSGYRPSGVSASTPKPKPRSKPKKAKSSARRPRAY